MPFWDVSRRNRNHQRKQPHQQRQYPLRYLLHNLHLLHLYGREKPLDNESQHNLVRNRYPQEGHEKP